MCLQITIRTFSSLQFVFVNFCLNWYELNSLKYLTFFSSLITLRQ